MEDRFVVERDLCSNSDLMAISPERGAVSNPTLSFEHVTALPPVMAFLAVYDGHNGAYVADILMQVRGLVIYYCLLGYDPVILRVYGIFLRRCA